MPRAPGRRQQLHELSALTGLRLLDVGHNSDVPDIEFVRTLTCLTDLDISGLSSVSCLAPLSGLTQLSELTCDNTAPSDLGPLSRLSRLHTLSCEWLDAVTSIAALTTLTQLRRLHMRGTPVLDLGRGPGCAHAAGALFIQKELCGCAELRRREGVRKKEVALAGRGDGR